MIARHIDFNVIVSEQQSHFRNSCSHLRIDVKHKIFGCSLKLKDMAFRRIRFSYTVLCVVIGKELHRRSQHYYQIAVFMSCQVTELVYLIFDRNVSRIALGLALRHIRTERIKQREQRQYHANYAVKVEVAPEEATVHVTFYCRHLGWPRHYPFVGKQQYDDAQKKHG